MQNDGQILTDAVVWFALGLARGAYLIYTDIFGV